jgi:hypothetical protein
MTLVNELGDPFGVEPILRVIGVATSTFYGWLKQAAEPSQRRRDDAVLVADIGRIHERSGQNPSATPAPDLVNRQFTAGDCCDNAMMESLWGRMQTELLDRRRWKTRIELANAIFDYLEIFHNRLEPAVPTSRNPGNISALVPHVHDAHMREIEAFRCIALDKPW